MTDERLVGLRVLVVEDEMLVSMLVEDMLADFGCSVIGPAPDLDSAMALASSAEIDAALLDVNVAGRAIFPVADALKARGYRWDGAQKVWHTRLGDEPALTLECEWLKTAVYNGRSSRVQVEELDGQTKYSARPGKVALREL